MNDDQMDELLIQGAQDYNEPRDIPREEMWARLSATRQAARTAPVVDIRPARRLRAWASVGVAAAAVLVLGIAIGRRLENRSTDQAPAIRTTAVLPTTKPDSPAFSPAAGITVGSKDTLVQKLQVETQNTQRRVQSLATTPRGNSRDDATTQNLAYRLVVLQHLAGTEAMITAFRSSAERGEVDAQIANWSRELLSTTRMLEASPVTEDPTMKRLLGDLDLVIVQISRYVTRGTKNPEDLDLIEQSINKRGVINQLRSTLPARNAPVGT